MFLLTLIFKLIAAIFLASILWEFAKIVNEAKGERKDGIKFKYSTKSEASKFLNNIPKPVSGPPNLSLLRNIRSIVKTLKAKEKNSENRDQRNLFRKLIIKYNIEADKIRDKILKDEHSFDGTSIES